MVVLLNTLKVFVSFVWDQALDLLKFKSPLPDLKWEYLYAFLSDQYKNILILVKDFWSSIVDYYQ